MLPLTSFGTLQCCLSSTQISLSPSTTTFFLRKDIFSAVLDFRYSSYKVKRNSSNKRHCTDAALIRGRLLLTFRSKCGAYLSKEVHHLKEILQSAPSFESLSLVWDVITIESFVCSAYCIYTLCTYSRFYFIHLSLLNCT